MSVSGSGTRILPHIIIALCYLQIVLYVRFSKFYNAEKVLEAIIFFFRNSWKIYVI